MSFFHEQVFQQVVYYFARGQISQFYLHSLDLSNFMDVAIIAISISSKLLTMIVSGIFVLVNTGERLNEGTVKHSDH